MPVIEGFWRARRDQAVVCDGACGRARERFAWADNEVVGRELRVEGSPTLGPDKQRLRVRWTPARSDGWAADYTFTISDELIRTAEFQHAA
jgi:hypothetical protein